MTQMSRRPGRRLLTALLCAQDAQGEGVCGSLGFAGRRRGSPHFPSCEFMCLACLHVPKREEGGHRSALGAGTPGSWVLARRAAGGHPLRSRVRLESKQVEAIKTKLRQRWSLWAAASLLAGEGPVPFPAPGGPLGAHPGAPGCRRRGWAARDAPSRRALSRGPRRHSPPSREFPSRILSPAVGLHREAAPGGRNSSPHLARTSHACSLF